MSKHSGPFHLWIFLLCAATAALLGFGWGLGDSFAVFGGWLLYVGGFFAARYRPLISAKSRKRFPA